MSYDARHEKTDPKVFAGFYQKKDGRAWPCPYQNIEKRASQDAHDIKIEFRSKEQIYA